ncbi:MarR family winged helix-turn-helix transcriptional regulator [Rhizobium sp. BK379]|uniref:MarR family winged helix-turn-helix transcriptional regulator n=1 Tax=Rhizobium sp. BK379 TaxID=2587059 RepID=UPI00161A3F06|nr:MarR family winged helix-turn-helix transcriptional regulator [Rhizobium sp. BK379]MBB3444497.1 DNA-binding MarR family transcriptional regulator [Rhizobium sp. BK379]
MTISQFSLLSVIDNHPNIRVSDLGEIMVMERTTLLRNLKPLQIEGLVTASRAKGERGHVFNLTTQGKAKLDQAVPVWNAAQATFEKEFGADRAIRLRDDNLAVSAISAL